MQQKPQGFKVMNLETLDQADEAYMVCMYGSAENSIVPSIAGSCQDCWRPIHWSQKAPVEINKLCVKCVLAKMEHDGAPQFVITPEMLAEGMEKMGLDDTSESRAHLQQIFTDKSVQVLRDQAAEIDRLEKERR